MGMFNWGNMIGWSNAASLQLRSNVTGFEMDDNGSSWIGSMMAFGGMVGSVFAGRIELSDQCLKVWRIFKYIFWGQEAMV